MATEMNATDRGISSIISLEESLLQMKKCLENFGITVKDQEVGSELVRVKRRFKWLIISRRLKQFGDRVP